MGELNPTPELAKNWGELAEGIETGERKISPEVRQSADNLIEMFGLKPNEELIIATDTGVINEFPEMVLALQQKAEAKFDELTEEGQPQKGRCKVLVAPRTENAAQEWGEAIGQQLDNRPVLIITSLSRSHSLETRQAINPALDTSRLEETIRSEGVQEAVQKGESTFTLPRLMALQEKLTDDPQATYEDFKAKFKPLAEAHKTRLISITRGTEKDIFTEGGATEDLEAIRERNAKIAEMMKNVTDVKVTSPLGTDLHIKPRVDKEIIDDGRYDQPGALGNFPIGEWSCGVGIAGTNGKIVVLNSPLGPGIDRPIVTEPVTIIIEDGKTVSIEGGVAAEKLKTNIATTNANYRAAHSEDTFADAGKVAEFGVGTNSKAFRIVDGKKVVAPTSVEGEKTIGTIHFALGGNGLYLQDRTDPEYNNISFHNDIVLTGVTVECYKKDGSSFTLLENGNPNGY